MNNVICIRLITHRNNTILSTLTNVHENIRFKAPCSLRVLSRFFGIQGDLTHLKDGIRDFKTKCERDSRLKVCTGGGILPGGTPFYNPNAVFTRIDAAAFISIFRDPAAAFIRGRRLLKNHFIQS